MERLRKTVLVTIMYLMVVLILMSFLTPYAHARPLTLTFGWQQDMSPGLKGWNLYMSETPGAFPPEPILSIFYDGNPQNEYTSDTEIFSPDGETHIYYFVLTAFDDATPDPNESGYSNEVSQVVDFAAPGIPFTFTVEIKPFP